MPRRIANGAPSLRPCCGPAPAAGDRFAVGRNRLDSDTLAHDGHDGPVASGGAETGDFPVELSEVSASPATPAPSAKAG